MRLLILGTEARYYYIRPEIPDDPNDVSKNFVVIPDVHRFVGRFRKPEIDRSREELLRVIDAPRIEKFLCSNNAEPLAQFRPRIRGFVQDGAGQLGEVDRRDRLIGGGVAPEGEVSVTSDTSSAMVCRRTTS